MQKMSAPFSSRDFFSCGFCFPTPLAPFGMPGGVLGKGLQVFGPLLCRHYTPTVAAPTTPAGRRHDGKYMQNNSTISLFERAGGNQKGNQKGNPGGGSTRPPPLSLPCPTADSLVPSRPLASSILVYARRRAPRAERSRSIRGGTARPLATAPRPPGGLSPEQTHPAQPAYRYMC